MSRGNRRCWSWRGRYARRLPLSLSPPLFLSVCMSCTLSPSSTHRPPPPHPPTSVAPSLTATYVQPEWLCAPHSWTASRCGDRWSSLATGGVSLTRIAVVFLSFSLRLFGLNPLGVKGPRGRHKTWILCVFLRGSVMFFTLLLSVLNQVPRHYSVTLRAIFCYI